MAGLPALVSYILNGLSSAGRCPTSALFLGFLAVLQVLFVAASAWCWPAWQRSLRPDRPTLKPQMSL